MAEYKFDVENNQDLLIDEHDIDNELVSQAAKYMNHAQAYVRAEAEYNLQKELFDQWYAKKDAEVRQEFDVAKKKATEKLIENTIKQLDEYFEQRKNVIQAKSKMEVLKASKESWWMRKDMLIQLAIKGRAELESTEMNVKKNEQFYN